MTISISSHVLDTATGKPAQGIPMQLFKQSGDNWQSIAKATTNSDGRVNDLSSESGILTGGIYKLSFALKGYFKDHDTHYFYPVADIIFQVAADEHYHIPLLISPFGYSTYRGS